MPDFDPTQPSELIPTGGMTATADAPPPPAFDPTQPSELIPAGGSDAGAKLPAFDPAKPAEIVYGGEVPLASLRWGLGTTFGLNPDGSVDTQDNGRGAPQLGSHNTRDPNLVGVALPEDVLRKELGDDPAVWRKAKVQAFTPDGRQITAPIVDLGPGEDPQARNVSIDLTFGATQALGASGNDPVGYRIIQDAQPDPLDNGVGHMHDIGSRFIKAMDKTVLGGAAGLARFSAKYIPGTAAARARANALADALQQANQDVQDYYATNPAHDEYTSAKIATAAGSVAGQVPLMATGAGALPLLATSGASGAFEEHYQAALADGKSEEEAKHAGLIGAARTAPELAGYLVAGKLGAMGAAKLLGPEATPLLRGIVGGATALPANMAASATIRAAEGQPVLPDAGSMTTDALFALFHGYGEQSRATRQANALVAAGEELAQRGIDPQTGQPVHVIPHDAPSFDPNAPSEPLQTPGEQAAAPPREPSRTPRPAVPPPRETKPMSPEEQASREAEADALAQFHESQAQGESRLLRKTAPEPDELATRLRERGFDFATPDDVRSAVEMRLRAGREQFGRPFQPDEMLAASPQQATLPRNVVAASSKEIKAIRADKDKWVTDGRTEEGAARLVDKWYKREAYGSVAGPDALYVTMPSTSGKNFLPLVLARRLTSDFGGEVFTGESPATPLARLEAKHKTGYQAKLADPVSFEPNEAGMVQLRRADTGRRVVIIDDVQNTGESLNALRQTLTNEGVTVAGSAILGLSDVRLTSARDMARLSEKIARRLQIPIDKVAPVVQSAFDGSFKQWFNYFERAAETPKGLHGVWQAITDRGRVGAGPTEASRAKSPGREEPPAPASDLGPSPETPPGSQFSPQQATLPRQIDAVTAQPVAEPIAEADIRDYLSRALDIPMRVGLNIAGKNVPKGFKVAGLFRSKAETIRTRTRNDTPTIFHETGHYLHQVLFTDPHTGRPSNFFNGGTSSPYEFELRQLGKLTSGPKYTPDQVRQEGVAEFFREWLTDRTQALAKAPDFTQFMEGELKSKYPDVLQILENARGMTNRFLTQPGWEKARSRIEFDPKPPRGTMRQWLQRQYTNWFNELAPIDRTMRRLQEFGLDPVTARQVSERAINFKGGWRGKADFDLEFDQTNLDGNKIGPGLKTILKGLAPKELGDFSTYVALRRAIEKGRQGIITGFESDLMDPVVRQKMIELGAIYEPKRQQLLKFSENTMNLLQESGLMSGEQVARIRAANKDYVPFYRVYEAVNGGGTSGPRGTGGSGGFVNTSSGVLRMKGDDRQIIDPLQSILKNTYMFRDLAERNRVGREFVAAVEKTQGGGRIGETVLKPMKPVQVSSEEVTRKLKSLGMAEADELVKQNPDLSLTLFRATDGVKPNDGVFRVWDGGKEKLFQVDDPDLLRSLAMADSVDANAVKLLPLFKPLQFATRILRAGATLTPEFIVRNPFRDQITAGVFSKYGFVPFFDGFRGMFDAIGKGEYYQQWIKAGGRYSGLYDVEGPNLKTTLERVVSDPGALQTALSLIDPRNVLRNLRAASSLMEEATRLAEFRKGVKSGADPMTAANASKDVTLNFSRYGIMGKILNQIYAFFNAGMQDIDKLVRAHREAPVRTMTKAFMYITAPSIAVWYAGKDDPKIQNLPLWRKNFFWNLNIEGHVFSFPKPFLLGALYGTSAEKALDYIYGKDPNAIFKGLSAIAGNLFPRADLIVASNAFKPLVENYMNKSFFTGRPLVNQAQDKLSPALQFTPTTSETAKFVGEKIGESPIMIDNLVRGYLGGLGRYGTDAIDWFLLKAQGQDTPVPPKKAISQYPVVRGFMPSPYEPSEYVQRFYKAMDTAERRLSDFGAYSNRLDVPGARQFALKNRNELVWYNAGSGTGENGQDKTVMTDLRGVRDNLSEINKAMAMVQQTRTMSAEVKAQRLLQLGQARDKIAEAAFKTYIHPTDRRKVF